MPALLLGLWKGNLKNKQKLLYLVSLGKEFAPLPSSKETPLLGSEQNPLARGENKPGKASFLARSGKKRRLLLSFRSLAAKII